MGKWDHLIDKDEDVAIDMIVDKKQRKRERKMSKVRTIKDDVQPKSTSIKKKNKHKKVEDYEF